MAVGVDFVYTKKKEQSFEIYPKIPPVPFPSVLGSFVTENPSVSVRFAIIDRKRYIRGVLAPMNGTAAAQGKSSHRCTRYCSVNAADIGCILGRVSPIPSTGMKTHGIPFSVFCICPKNILFNYFGLPTVGGSSTTESSSLSV